MSNSIKRPRVARVVSLSEETHQKDIRAMTEAAAAVQARRSNLTGQQQQVGASDDDDTDSLENGEKSQSQQQQLLKKNSFTSSSSPAPTAAITQMRTGFVSFVDQKEEKQSGLSTTTTTNQSNNTIEEQNQNQSASETTATSATNNNIPAHKKAFPAIYDEKSTILTENFLKELSKMFSTQFVGLHLTPMEMWGADDDAEAALIASGEYPSSSGLSTTSSMVSSSTNRNNQIRMGRRRSSIAQQALKGTYSVLSRLSGTRDVVEIASGKNNMFDDDHKLTFTSDGSTGSGQRIGETTPPTVLVSVTAHPVRAVGGMLLIDGSFAFHNSPFLDKRAGGGRVKVPVDRELVKNVHQMVTKSKEWQNLILNKHHTENNDENNNNNNNDKNNNDLINKIMNNNNPDADEEDSNADTQEAVVVVGGQDSLLQKRRQSSVVSNNSNSTSSSPLGQKKSSSSTKKKTVLNRQGNDNDSNQSSSLTATLLFHEYAGAASPADDWIIQTFQLIDPSSGLPAGPTVVRGFKTQQAILRRERKIEMVQAQIHQHELLLMQQSTGGGGVGASSGGTGRSGSIFAKRGSVLLDKYSISGINQNPDASVAASFRTPGSMRRKSLSTMMMMNSNNNDPNASPNSQSLEHQQQIAGGASQRQLLPEEEVLRFRNPAMFAWVATQDLFELLAATNVIRSSIQQYRSSFIVRRTLKRMFWSVGVIQRFCRSLSRRRQSAMQRIVRDWCKLESDFVHKLRKYKPLEGDVIDGLVAKNLADHALTPHDEKRKRIEDAWRASRWEIAVAWRISSTFSPFQNSLASVATSVKTSSLKGEKEKDKKQNDSQDDDDKEKHEEEPAFGTTTHSLTKAYEDWAREHKVVRKRVFSYFISAKPLFEAAQRRLAIQCGFGKDSVYRSAAMVEILKKAGCSLSEMQKRRREIFFFEAQLAEQTVLKKRQKEQQILRDELVRREEEKSIMLQSKTFSNDNTNAMTAESNYFQTQTHQAMAGRRNAFSQFQQSSVKKSRGMMMGASSSSSSAFFGNSLVLPPKPAEYDEGEFTAIQNVMMAMNEAGLYIGGNFDNEEDALLDGDGSHQKHIKPLRRLKQYRRRSSSAFSSSSFTAFGNNNNNNSPTTNSNNKKRKYNDNNDEDDYYYSPQDEEEREQAKLVASIAQHGSSGGGIGGASKRRPFGENPPPPWLLSDISHRLTESQTARNFSSNNNDPNKHVNNILNDFHLPPIQQQQQQQVNNNTSRAIGIGNTTNKNENQSSSSSRFPNIRQSNDAKEKQRQRAHVPILQMAPSSSNVFAEEESFVAPSWSNTIIRTTTTGFVPKNNNNTKQDRRESKAESNAEGAGYISAQKLKEQQQNILRRGISLPWVHRQQTKEVEEQQQGFLGRRK